MTRNWPQRRVRGGQTEAIGLCILILSVMILCFPCKGVPQITSASPETVQARIPANASAPPGIQTSEPQLAPDAAPWPYRRLLIVLLLGLVFSYCKLASKFEHYWHLGATTNGYAVLYLVTGTTLCYLFHIAGIELRGPPLVQTAGPWIGDGLGLAAVLVGPSIWHRSRAHPEGKSQAAGLPVEFSRNPFFAVLEGKVQDCIANRMQKEVVAASEQYGWKTIKQAAHKALGEGRAMRQFSDEDFKSETKFISSLPGTAKPGADYEGKCDALYRMLRLCKFRRLSHFLKEEMKEGRP